MDEIKTVNDHNEQFAVIATEDELISKYYRPATDIEIVNGECLFKTATDVATNIKNKTDYSMTKSSARDFGMSLTKTGFRSKKLKQTKMYAVIELE